ncbi:acyltransferase [Paraburkholderia sediminicola]|uniref:acyltransferase family protein n=1 Tax=Paraburkholderia sediminicola TaxID=458836 RepID=UPI0038B9D1DC
MQAQKIDSLTSLRFFAAAIIVIGHGNRLFGSLGLGDNFAGDQAVSFFFALSGFILAHTYHNRLDEKAAIQRYYVSRIARVWPLHVISGAAALILIVGARTSLPIVITNMLLLQSWVPSMPYYFSLNGVAWSISVEAFFYLLFPILIYNVKASWHWKLATTLVLAAASMVIADGVSPDAAFWASYIFPVGRLPEFMLGICAYTAFISYAPRLTRKQATAIEITLLVAVVASMRVSRLTSNYLASSHPNLYSLSDWITSEASTPLFAVVIFFFAFEIGAVSQMLRGRFWVILGESSFALYMIHQIILRMMWERYTFVKSLPNGPMWMVYVISSLLIAIAVHYRIESPIRKFTLRKFDIRSQLSPPQQSRLG